MLLFVVLFLFFVLHVQFLLRNVLFGTYETNYFIFRTVYIFDRHVALVSLAFTLACAIAFSVLYLAAYRPSSRSAVSVGTRREAVVAPLVRQIVIIFGGLQVLTNLYLAYNSNFDYQTMAEAIEDSAFVFQLRILMLIALAFIMLNVRPRTFWRGAEFRAVRFTVVFYLLSVLFVQMRTSVFEVAAIVLYSYLMWHADRVKIRYVLLLVGAMVVPNIIVLGRLGIPSEPALLLSGLFSFEYSALLNNLLGAAIEGSFKLREGFTFLNSLWLLIPSPVRDALGIDVVKSEAYEALSRIANVRNGGYSMVAEMYQNFEWGAVAVFGLFGYAAGLLNRRAAQVGEVDVLTALGPILFTAFIIAFRNDFGVFIKTVIQTYIVAVVMIPLFARSAARSPPEVVVAGESSE